MSPQKMAGGGGGGGWLPEELSLHILSRLRDTASLVRFRCVSKSWCAFLSDPNFIRKAIFFSDEEETEIEINKARLIMFPPTASSSYSIHSLDDTLPTISSGTLPGFHQTEGCCDGIFCISSSDRIALWNPTTSEVKVLPSSTHLKFLGRVRDQSNRANIGFGFDPVTNDYKVVFTCERDSWKQRVTCVYSLKRDTWRYLRRQSAGLLDGIGRRVGVFNSRLVASRSRSSCLWLNNNFDGNFNLTMFNMSREAFRQLWLPRPPDSGDCTSTRLEMATNGACLIDIDYGNNENRFFFKVWATLDYASGQYCSWIRLYDIVCPNGAPSFSLPRGELEVAGFWKHGKWLARVRNDDELLVIDAEKNEWSSVHHVDDIRLCSFEVVTYVPSMMSLSRSA